MDDDDNGEPPEEESAGGGKSKKKASGALANLAQSANDVPPNFNLLVVFALGLLRALLRKMSGEAYGLGWNFFFFPREDEHQHTSFFLI